MRSIESRIREERTINNQVLRNNHGLEAIETQGRCFRIRAILYSKKREREGSMVAVKKEGWTW